MLINALDHPTTDVAEQAIAGLGPLLRTDPTRFGQRLAAAAGQHPAAVAAALNTASRRRPATWVPELTPEQRTVLLAIVAELPDWDWSIQHLVAALATGIPALVMQMLSNRATGPSGVPRIVDGLAAALSTHPHVLADWIRDTARADPSTWREQKRVWPLIAGANPTPGALAATGQIAADGVPAELDFLTSALAHCDGLILHHVELVRALSAALQNATDDIRERALARLQASAHPQIWWAAEPPAVLVERRDLARALAERADLTGQLRALYQDTADLLQHTIDSEVRQDADEDQAHQS